MINSAQAEIPDSARNIAVSVRDVSKSYKLYPSHQDRLKEALHPFRKPYHKEFLALNGVSFDILRGQNVGIIGRNGAGKSTLLQLIAGVLRPTSGKISVTGKVAALLELGAGFNPDRTGRENVILFGTIIGVPKKEMADRVNAVEAFADIGMFFDQPIKVYSSGMVARVAFANAIHVNPDVLIVDEILGVGDIKFQEKCYSKIKSLRDQGVCILFVSHSTEVIQRNCEFALLLEGGKAVKYGPADAVVATYHDLLYGSYQPDPVRKTATDELPMEIWNHNDNARIKEFLDNSGEPFFRHFHYYNPHERRLGNGDADIIDFLVTVDGNAHFNRLTGQEKLKIYLKVHFNKRVDVPRIGWALASPEAIVIAGSNTEMKNVLLPTAHDGETWIYAMTVEPRLCGGQYFLNFGVGGYDGESRVFFDERRAVVHLAVGDSGKASGFFEAPSDFEIVRSPRIV